ncbi:MAG: alpha-galactosidase [Clostridiales bacterium]|nr:alpha-galactosidase [Clostridiales bacterium]
MKTYSEYHLGDMLARYVTDEAGHIGLMLIPANRACDVLEKPWAVESLVQCHARGDQLPNGYGNGHTMATSTATARMKLCGQERQGGTIVTTLADDTGRRAYHHLTWHEGLQALRVSTVFENVTDAPITLDLLSSVNLGGITPFTASDACGALMIHRARSAWSAEGRLQSESAETLHLERSWTGHALRVEKFGQIGSMPVRQWFPFLAVEDTAAGVTWAMQLACPSSWQAELRRKDDGLNLMMGLPDEDFGHWCKTLQPGETFEAPEAYLTVGEGSVDAVSQRLLSVQRENWLRRAEPLPVMFNEYCTTWGEPSHTNMVRIADCLRGRGIDIMVMDAGWYAKGDGGWSDCGGDWIPNEARLFPQGLKATADAIRDAGMKPGIWFEMETCAKDSDVFKREDMLLTRHGVVIDTDNRRFLDMRKQAVQDYLQARVTGLLQQCGFEYIKVDYNDCIGVGCDDPDSLGEGLRQNMQGTLRFLRAMREAVPGLYIENCASGGHRLEPSLMAITDMASFSDAHECAEIPIIAANLHRLILPGQSQIWAVLRHTDSLRRINYSLVNTFLGVMCLSGDVLTLTDAQWHKVAEGIDFYRAVRGIIRDGVSEFHGTVSASWRHPTGWQAICRRAGAETLVVLHTFGGGFPQQVTLPVAADRILRVMCSEDNEVTLIGGQLTIALCAPFEAVAVHLRAGDGQCNQSMQ